MYRKVAAVVLPFLIVAGVGVSVWAYNENTAKKALLIKAENQYQRAFHNLNFYLDKLEDEIGEALASNSREQIADSLTTVWRLAYSAQNAVGQLPLALMPFDSVQKLMAKIGDFAYSVGIRDLNAQPLTPTEFKTLQELYKRTNEIEHSLNNLQSRVLDNGLQWTDVELALASDKQGDNVIVDGFKKVNSMVESYQEVDFGPQINNAAYETTERLARLTGESITLTAAKQKIAQLVGLKTTKNISGKINTSGNYASYFIDFKNGEGSQVSAEVTKVGGYVLWVNYDRDVKSKKLSQEEALHYANHFTEKMGYASMVPISFTETDNVITFTLVHKEAGILNHLETLAVKVALDNGDVMGVNSTGYIFNSMHEPHGRPTLTLYQARKKISPRVKVFKSNLALIYNELGQKVLCYEFLTGFSSQDKYRVFINAKSGMEEAVQKVKEQDI